MYWQQNSMDLGSVNRTGSLYSC